MAKIVIIGAGLTGLSAAYHLEQKGFYDYALFEKGNTIGGLCGSIYQDGFTFDYTGHYLHASDPYFKSMIEQLVGMENLNTIEKKSFIYSHGIHTRYPFQINLYGLPASTIAECVEGFVKRTVKKKVTSFPEWVESNFGAGFGKHFFMPFQRKIFGYELNKITASWTGRFVPKTSLEQIIEGSIKDNDVSLGYNATFLYPKKGGIIFWVQKIADQLHNPIQRGFQAQSINLKNKTVTFTNGHIEPFEQLISTIPLDTLLENIEEKSSSNLKSAASNLLCNSVMNFNLGVNREQISEKHWIYYPETQFPFYRIGFPSNCAASMAPAGCSSLYGEFSYVKKSKQYVNQTLNSSVAITKKLFGISEQEVATEKIIPIKHAYVIYDFWREKNLPKLLKRLEENQIYSIGRYGEWKYSSMQEAVLDGKKVAERLVIMPAKLDVELMQLNRVISQKQQEV